MKKLFLTGLVTLLFSVAMIAQEVSGTVNGDDGAPLPGASVQIKGTSSGTITDFEGNYTITANQGDTLVFSYLGFGTQEIVVDGNVVNATLQAGLALETVVVVGSRNPNRTATETSVPVDVIDVQSIVTQSRKYRLIKY